MTLRLFYACLALAWGWAALPAQAQDADRIAAVVNDSMISVQDLNHRLRLAIALSRLEDTPDVRRRIIPQVLRKMIDETLQAQEAKRLKISLSPEEVASGIAALEQQNRMPKGGYTAVARQLGIPPDVITDQIKADLTWRRVNTRVLLPTVRIGEEEISDQLQMIQARQGQPEYLAAEIYLAVEQGRSEDDVRALGERLLQQLRQGTSFQDLARQFSQSPTSAAGGMMGWVSGDGVDPELLTALEALTPGNISPLVQSGTGYYILALLNRRIAGDTQDATNAKVGLVHIVLPYPKEKGGPDRQALMRRAHELTRDVKSCPALEALARQIHADKVEQIPPTALDELPPQVRAFAAPAAVNAVSSPMDEGEGIGVLMLCSREEQSGPAKLPSRDAIRRKIEAERMDMLSRRYLRDLRRAAFIDVRM